MSATAADGPRGGPARDKDKGRPFSSRGTQFGALVDSYLLRRSGPVSELADQLSSGVGSDVVFVLGHWYYAKVLLIRTRVRLLERSKRHANRQIRVWAHLFESRTSVSYIVPNAPWVQVDDSGTMPAAESSRYRPREV